MGALSFHVNNRFTEMVKKMSLLGPTANGVKTPSSLEMGWDWTSLGNRKLNHHLLTSGHIAPLIDKVFLGRVQQAQPEAVTVTVDEFPPTPPAALTL